jgi:hypothetical protein
MKTIIEKQITYEPDNNYNGKETVGTKITTVYFLGIPVFRVSFRRLH